VLVGVKRDRAPMIVQISLQRTDVGVRVLAGHEAQLHELVCGVIDEGQQRTGLATLLEPAMIAPIDLDELTVALASKSGVVKGSDGRNALTTWAFYGNEPRDPRGHSEGTTSVPWRDSLSRAWSAS
jgi:hypothetical protein